MYSLMEWKLTLRCESRGFGQDGQTHPEVERVSEQIVNNVHLRLGIDAEESAFTQATKHLNEDERHDEDRRFGSNYNGLSVSTNNGVRVYEPEARLC